jgi:acyl-CoA thioester hydrolase
LTAASTPSPNVAAARRLPQPRDAYAVFRPITMRWADNDVCGHVNNVVYYSWSDTAVNAYLIDAGVLDTHGGETIV